MIKTVAGKDILFVMAARAEYGSYLSALFTPIFTGIGPVEASISLTQALGKLEREGAVPDLVVSLGSAGSAKLPQAEIFQVSSVSYRDMDASPLGFEKGKTPLLDLPVIIPMPCLIPDIAKASLSTGGNIVSGAAYETIDADMVDMETFACLRVCHLFGVPMIGLRGISDGLYELSHITDWTQYLHVIDEKLAKAVEQLERVISADGLTFFQDRSIITL